MTHSWDEPVGATPRGTVILLPGRGETATSYHRFGSRLAVDAYKVRLVEVDLDDLDRTRTEVQKLLVDESLPGPKVLIGSDTGANLAAGLAADDSVDADAAVLAGLVQPGSVHAGADSSVEVRTACPVHRRVIAEDDGYDRDALAVEVPAELAMTPAVTSKPLLVVHGGEDVVSEPTAVVAAYVGAPRAQVRLVVGGRHDILNDVSHRSVAATIVLFLESLRLGRDLPPVLVPAPSTPSAPVDRSA